MEKKEPNSVDTAKKLAAYYRFHAHIYNATRWFFLFGRRQLIEDLAKLESPKRILEVGCGTGKNLVLLRRVFPAAKIVGIDLSEAMLGVARRKVGPDTDQIRLVQGVYPAESLKNEKFDMVVFSYALSMINPGWENAIAAAYDNLVPGGLMVVVDFHESPWNFFRCWMGLNHVRLSGHLLPELRARFQPKQMEICWAYLRFWTWFRFVGQKTTNSAV